jgi:hypothetical protein
MNFSEFKRMMTLAGVSPKRKDGHKVYKKRELLLEKAEKNKSKILTAQQFARLLQIIEGR